MEEEKRPNHPGVVVVRNNRRNYASSYYDKKIRKGIDKENNDRKNLDVLATNDGESKYGQGDK